MYNHKGKHLLYNINELLNIFSFNNISITFTPIFLWDSINSKVISEYAGELGEDINAKSVSEYEVKDYDGFRKFLYDNKNKSMVIFVGGPDGLIVNGIIRCAIL